MYLIGRRGWPDVERVIIVVCMVVGDEGCEVGIVVHVKDRDRVVYGVGQDLIVAVGVLNGVLTHRVVHADGGREVRGVLGDFCGCWWERC